MQIVQNHQEGTVWLGQPTFTKSILSKYRMSDAKPVKTPVCVNSSSLKPQKNLNLSIKACTSLLWEAYCICLPDVVPTLCLLSAAAQFCSKPTKPHWTAVKQIFRYLRGTTGLGLLYAKGADSDNMLVGYSDADWAGDCTDYKYTSGYLFQIGGTVVTWNSKKQSCIALSTGEAEYMALLSASQEAIWIRELNSDLGNQQSQPTLILEDNQLTIAMAKNPQYHGRSKHINSKFHFVREQVSNSKVCLKYNCPTEDMLADMMTKAVGPEKLNRLKRQCGMYKLVLSEKECG